MAVMVQGVGKAAIKANRSTKAMMWLKTFGNPNNGPNPVIFDECYGVRALPWGGYGLACGTGIEPPYVNEDDPSTSGAPMSRD